MNDLQEVIDLSVQSEQNPVSFLHAEGRSSGRLFPHGTRCIIDGWLIGNSITQRLLGWQTLGHRNPVRTIELEQRREGKVSFRDAFPLSADLLGIPNGHSLVQSLTDDLPNNCSCSWEASWLDSGTQTGGERLVTGEPVSEQCGVVVHFEVEVVCGGFLCACTLTCLCIPHYNLIFQMTAALSLVQK